MSKTIPAPLLTHIAQPVTTLAYILTITRRDGVAFGMTEHSSALTVGGVVHQPGLTVGALASACGMEVDGGIFEVIPRTDPIINIPDLLSGVWDGAEVLIRQVNWMAPSDGTIGHKRGHVGNIEPTMGSVRVEVRDLRQALRTDTSGIYQANCRYRLGDTKCTVDLEPFTFSGTVEEVVSQMEIVDSGLAQAADYFTEGELTFTSGENNGKSVKVRLHEAGGVLHLDIDLIAVIDVGDTFDVVAGCLKRYTEDCVGKFDNGLNYGAEKDKPQVSDVVGSPT